LPIAAKTFLEKVMKKILVAFLICLPVATFAQTTEYVEYSSGWSSAFHTYDANGNPDGGFIYVNPQCNTLPGYGQYRVCLNQGLSGSAAPVAPLTTGTIPEASFTWFSATNPTPCNGGQAVESTAYWDARYAHRTGCQWTGMISTPTAVYVNGSLQFDVNSTFDGGVDTSFNTWYPGHQRFPATLGAGSAMIQ
jgi:hypothetical protein